MDFYLTALRFLTDLAVNAKSCLNSNKQTAICASYYMVIIYSFLIFIQFLFVDNFDLFQFPVAVCPMQVPAISAEALDVLPHFPGDALTGIDHRYSRRVRCDHLP